MYAASLALLAAAAVTLVLGFQREGVTLFLVSTACSVLASLLAVVSLIAGRGTTREAVSGTRRRDREG